MRQFKRAAAVVALLLAAAATLLLGPAAQPAQADRCQPEEIVLGNGNSPMQEEDSPVCWVMLPYVYPSLSCDRTSMMSCVNTLNAADTVKTQLNCVTDPIPHPDQCPLIDPVIP